MPSPTHHPRDPLHGITLETIVKQLAARHGWNEMARRIPIRCFMFDPSVTSSLKFLRKTPWARQKVEGWFISELPVRPPPPRTDPPVAEPSPPEAGLPCAAGAGSVGSLTPAQILAPPSDQ